MASRYIWSRYSLATSVTLSEGDALFSSSNTSGTMGFSSTADMYFAKTLSYSVTTGKFSGGSKVLIDLDEYYDDGYSSKSSYASVSASTYPYLLYCSSGSTTTTQAYTTSGSWHFYTDGTNLTLVKYNQVYKMEAEVSYSQGSTEYGYVAAKKAASYPTDGSSGSYWYVYEGSDSITPAGLTCSTAAPAGGDTLTLTTAAGSCTYGGTITYTYQVSLDGADYETISTTTGTTLAYTVPAGTETVQFRVLAADSYGFTDTEYVYTDALPVSNNTAPTVPGTPEAAGTVLGGSTVSISWDASEDEDGDLTGYCLERQYNGGSWTQIYQGTATETTDSITWGWVTVQYRVRAYDSCGAYSDYAEGEEITVVNNSAPSAPLTVTVPAAVYADTAFKISWSAASDADGDTVYYEVQYTLDADTWSSAGTDLTVQYLTLTITEAEAAAGGTSLQVRVRAYDSYGDCSDWTCSAVRTVTVNTAPVITVTDADGSALDSGASLGTYADWDAGPEFGIAVTDPQGDAFALSVLLDGSEIYTLEQADAVSLELTGLVELLDGTDAYQKVLNGTHTLSILADDGEETAAWSGSFTKAVSGCVITKHAYLETESTITGVLMSLSGSGLTDYTLLVTADGGSSWEDAGEAAAAGSVYTFTNTGTQFGFILTVPGTDAGYITSIQGSLLVDSDD